MLQMETEAFPPLTTGLRKVIRRGGQAATPQQLGQIKRLDEQRAATPARWSATTRHAADSRKFRPLWMLISNATSNLLIYRFCCAVAARQGGIDHERISEWPAPGSEDTELGALMELEVGHGETEVYPRTPFPGTAR
jgi:hypothetical protein